MIKKDPLLHFPFYCNQYLGMIAKYTYEEQGAFIRVLATIIAEDGHLSCDSKNVRYRLFSAFTESEQKAVDIVFSPANDLAKEIMQRQKTIRKKKRESGKLGGRPADSKKNNHKVNHMVNQKGNLTLTYTETETETETETD